MSKPFTIDRFEGDDKSIAVLVAHDGTTREVARSKLPRDAKPGDVLTADLKIDREATQAIAKATHTLQAELTADDAGEDIAL